MNRNTAILSLLLALALTLSGCGKTQPAPALSGQDSAPSSQNSVGGAASEPAVTPDIRPAGPGVEAAGTPAETAGELVFTMDYDLGLLDGSDEAKAKRTGLWQYLKDHVSTGVYRAVRYNLGGLTDLKFPGGDKLTLGVYRQLRKIFKFN